MNSIKTVPVDINNEMVYNGITYEVSPKLNQYQVKNYPILLNGSLNEYTNESEMDSVIVIDDGKKLKFLDEKGKDISKDVSQMNHKTN